MARRISVASTAMEHRLADLDDPKPVRLRLMVNGYFLNNEADRFQPVADALRLPGRQRLEPGQAPAQFDGADHRLRPGRGGPLAVGAAGGATIIAQVGAGDHRGHRLEFDCAQALALPVIFAPGDTIFVERGTQLEAMIPALQAMGHAKIDFREPTSFKANAIERAGGRWAGAADPRSEGIAVGE